MAVQYVVLRHWYSSYNLLLLKATSTTLTTVLRKWRKIAHDDGLCVSCKSIAQPRTNLRQVEAVFKAAAAKAAFYAYVFPLT